MGELGRDVAGVEIDDDGLHLQHVGGAGLALLGDRAGDDIDAPHPRATPRWRRSSACRRREASASIQMLCGLPSRPCPLSTKPRTGIRPSQ